MLGMFALFSCRIPFFLLWKADRPQKLAVRADELNLGAVVPQDGAHGNAVLHDDQRLVGAVSM